MSQEDNLDNKPTPDEGREQGIDPGDVLRTQVGDEQLGMSGVALREAETELPAEEASETLRSLPTSPLLTDPIRQQVRLFVKGDDETIEHLLRVCFSSYTSNPMNLGLMAPFSEGKSYPITQVCKLFSNSTFFTGSTSKAFFYEAGELVDGNGNSIQGQLDRLQEVVNDIKATKEARRGAKIQVRELLKISETRVNLGGRILVFLDAPEYRLWDALKPLLSHDVFESTYQTVDKNMGGAQRTKKIRLRGWPAVIFASARNEDEWQMWLEIKSRFNVISPRMNSAKYAAANTLTSQLRGRPSFLLKQQFPEDMEVQARNDIRRVRQNIEKVQILAQTEGSGSPRDNITLNLFADWLKEEFPHESGIRMRQFAQLHGYINISCLMNYDRRLRLVIDGHERAMLVSWADVASSLKLVLGSFGSLIPEYKVAFFKNHLVPCCTRDQSKPLVRNFLEALKPEPRHDGVEARTLSEIVDWVNSHGERIGPNRVRKTYLSALVEAGFVREETDPVDKRHNLYTPLIEALEKTETLGGMANGPLIDPQIVKTALERFESEMTGLNKAYGFPDGSLTLTPEQVINFVISPLALESLKALNHT